MLWCNFTMSVDIGFDVSLPISSRKKVRYSEANLQKGPIGKSVGYVSGSGGGGNVSDFFSCGGSSADTVTSESVDKKVSGGKVWLLTWRSNRDKFKLSCDVEGEFLIGEVEITSFSADGSSLFLPFSLAGVIFLDCSFV